MNSATPENRFNTEESGLFKKKGWMNYARRLIEWRWTGKDTAFPERQHRRSALELTHIMQNGGQHDPASCLDPRCGFDFRPAPRPSQPESTGTAPGRTGKQGEKLPKRKFTAEAVEPPKESTSRALAVIEEPPLRLTEAGVKPLEGGLSKGLAIAGGATAIGVILLGGRTATRGIWGYDDPQTGQHHKGDVGHLVIGLAEMGAGAAGLTAAVTGRLKLWSPVHIR